MNQPAGYACLVLHAHLPYVRHPEHDEFLEEDWLFEAITECYVPLLMALERLEEEGVPHALTLNLSPTLVAMLGDGLLNERYLRHLGRQQGLVRAELAKSANDVARRELLEFHLRWFDDTARFISEQAGGLLGAFRRRRETGQLEIITCTATHGFLPLMSNDSARRAQLRVGVQAYTEVFGAAPRGIWLAECAYRPGFDDLIAEQGLDYFFVDTHGLINGTPQPVYGPYAPVGTPAGPAAFARDLETSQQVWSSEVGYPGDPWYREFYRDLGYDAPYETIAPFLHADGVRRSVGVKMHRVTGAVPLDQKQAYEPARAMERAREHAGHFHFHRVAQAKRLRAEMNRPPVIAAMYDAELFGHWWFEGPRFIEEFFRIAARYPDELRLVTASGALDAMPRIQRVQPAASSWGENGFNAVWLNGENAWFYRHQHHAESRMESMAARHPSASGPLRELLDAAARELLLAQSSDWAFIVHTGTTVPYALKRFRTHIDRFHSLADLVQAESLDAGAAAALLHRLADDAPLFPWLDYRVYR